MTSAIYQLSHKSQLGAGHVVRSRSLTFSRLACFDDPPLDVSVKCMSDCSPDTNRIISLMQTQYVNMIRSKFTYLKSFVITYVAVWRFVLSCAKLTMYVTILSSRRKISVY